MAVLGDVVEGHPHLGEQGGEPCVDGPFGADEVVEVYLGEHNLLVDAGLHAPSQDDHPSGCADA